MDANKPKVIDLFAGVGGFSLGLMRAGFDLALAIDKDKHAMAAHKVNFPNLDHLLTDISDLDGNILLQRANLGRGQLAGLVGGPPCQGFSTMGKRDLSDSRNDLFNKFFELVQQSKPKFYVAENVLGILHAKYEEILTNALALVEDEYVMLPPLRLKASDFGAPTIRERVFFIGYRSDKKKVILPEHFEDHKVSKITTVTDALMGLPRIIDENWLSEKDGWRSYEPLPNSYFWDRVKGHIPENVGDKEALRRFNEEKIISGCLGTRHNSSVLKRYEILQQGERDNISRASRLDENGLCPTIRAGTGSDRGSFQAVRPIHPIMPRVITPREAARLQGFPDWFQFAPSKWHSFRQIGNSVSPIVSEVIFRVIASQLDFSQTSS